MADTPNGTGRPPSATSPGNRIFNDKYIAYGLAGVAALVFGSLMNWQLQTTIDIRERIVRIETVVFPPPISFNQQHERTRP